MTKILHISKFFYPYYGGIEDMALTIVDELKNDFKQLVFCFNHENGTKREKINDVDVVRIGTLGVFSSQPVSFKYISELRKVINEFNPDYIHLHLPNPLASLAILVINPQKPKLILHWHADILNKGILYSLVKPIENKIVKNAYKIVCTSANYAQNSPIVHQYLDKLTVLQSTIDEEKLRITPDEQTKIDNLKKKYGNKKIVFFVGRHVPYKGIKYLIEAGKYISEDCVIVIAGSGELTEKLKLQCAANKRIIFTGKLSNEELKYYLYASTVFAFPSTNRSEAFGLALAEALYCGLPAVSFNIKGSGSLWVNKNNFSGYIVENKNSKAFAQAVSKILSSEELQKTLSVNAKQWANENFTKKVIVTKLINLYK